MKTKRPSAGEDRQRDGGGFVQQVDEDDDGGEQAAEELDEAVPMRLRTPSTSVMMRATRVPVRFSS